MAYTINLTNGTSLISGGLTDGTIDTSHTSITLIGKDYAGYGQYLNDNFVQMLENFSNTSSPPHPLTGQLWWDTLDNTLKVYTGNTWKISTGATSAPYTNPPGDLSALGGDLWFDSTNSQLKVSDKFGQWHLIGPIGAGALSTTGAFPDTAVDTNGGSHVIVKFQINGTTYAIFSKDTFNTSISGFASIKSGLNFSTIASPAMGLSTQDTLATASTLVQRDTNAGITVAGLTSSSITTGPINASTLTLSGALLGDVSGNVTATTISTGSLNATGQITTSTGFSGTLLTANQPNITGLGTLTGLGVSGTTTLTGTTTLSGTATLNGAAIATYGSGQTFSSINNTPIGNTTPSTGAFTSITATTSILPTANLVVNLGSSSYWFNNIYGTAIHAQYADLAERFHADDDYPAGTVVEIGGPYEITKVVAELSDKVFGVISTNAAYLMNSSAGDDTTHPPIAIGGRVPVRVTGVINKGDRLVSAGNGIARAATMQELTPFNVIGRSLVDKTDEAEGIIEAIVKINS